MYSLSRGAGTFVRLHPLPTEEFPVEAITICQIFWPLRARRSHVVVFAHGQSILVPCAFRSKGGTRDASREPALFCAYSLAECGVVSASGREKSKRHQE